IHAQKPSLKFVFHSSEFVVPPSPPHLCSSASSAVPKSEPQPFAPSYELHCLCGLEGDRLRPNLPPKIGVGTGLFGPAPPSELDVRISRIQLSGRRNLLCSFTETGTPFFGSLPGRRARGRQSSGWASVDDPALARVRALCGVFAG